MSEDIKQKQGVVLQILLALTKGQFASFYALLITLFGMGYIVALTFVAVPTANQATADKILMFVLGTMVATAVAYILGSSKGSADKTNLLANKQEATEQDA